MSVETTKPLSEKDYSQTLQGAYNDVDKTLSVNGFIVGKVGHRITRSDYLTVGDDYSFYDGATLLYTIRVIYTTSSKSILSSVERIA
jgi:hypothetical protein